MMRLEEVEDRLRNRLAQDLPGKDAHLRMAPQPVDLRRFDPIPPANHRKSSVLILLYPQGNSVFFPLIKRPVYAGVHSGQVSLPGGKMEPDDHDVVYTALREAKEEIGADPQRLTVLGKLTDLYIPPSNFLVTPIVASTWEKPALIPQEREVSRIIIQDFRELLQADLVKHRVLELGGGLRLNTPFFELDGEMVWGATAMILSELVLLFREQ